MTWLQWTDRIARHVFSPLRAGEMTYLAVSTGMLDSIGSDLGGAGGFLSTVRRGPIDCFPAICKELPPDHLFERGRRLHPLWRENIGGIRQKCYESVPVYLNYLSLLCYAWSSIDDANLPAAEFYARIQKAYGPNNLSSTNLGAWDDLWNGLCAWSNAFHRGNIGKLHVFALGPANVGKPRSQVMFKAKQITHALPQLFADIGLMQEASDQDLNTQLLLHAGRYIGESLSEQLHHGPHGPEILSRLRQEFRVWDGEILTADRQSGSHPKPILLALVQVEDGWKKCGVIDMRTADANEDSVLDDVITATRGAYSLSDQPPPLESTAILIPDADAGMLVQSRSLPPGGPCYFLVPRELVANWRVWQRTQRSLRWSQVCIPQDGLAAGEILEVIEDVNDLHGEALRSMPGAPPPVRMQRLRFVGGTRIGRAVGGSMYLAYDLPLLRAIVEGAELPIASGGDIESLPQAEVGSFATVGAAQIRHFRLRPDPESTLVKITHGSSIVNLHLGYLADSDARTAGNMAIDPLGRAIVDPAENGAHCRGVSCPIGRRDIEEVLPHRFGTINGGDPRPRPDSPSLKLSEVLRGLVEASGGSPVSWQRARQAITRVAERSEIFIRPFEISRLLRSLCDLGHVDVATDLHGRWSWISLPRPQSYLLPWIDHQGNRIAILAGCAAAEMWNRAETEAVSQGLAVSWKTQGDVSPLIPPRLSVSGSLRALGEWAKALSLPIAETSAACAIAFWASDIDAWRASLPSTWSEEIGEATRIYAPAMFSMLNLVQAASPDPNRIALIQCFDPYTGNDSLFKLAMKKDGVTQCIPCPDLAWGKWMDYASILAPFGAVSGIPRDSQTGDIIVPFGLRLPYLLSRAATLCSGLAPIIEWEHAVFRDRQIQNLIQLAADPYAGPCIIYRHVPESISHRIAGQLGAKIVNWDRPRAADSGRVGRLGN